MGQSAPRRLKGRRNSANGEALEVEARMCGSELVSDIELF